MRFGRALVGSAAAVAAVGGVLSSSGASAVVEARSAATTEVRITAAVEDRSTTVGKAQRSGPGERNAADAAPRWQWPVAPPRMVQAYAAPPSPYAAGHRGIDLASAAGTIVAAPSDATVHFVGVVVDRPVLTLDHGSGVLSSYEPLVADGLRAGDSVARGSPLGVVGTRAHCSNACLHVGVRIDGTYVSPLLFFDRVPRSVLLPLHGSPAVAIRRGDERSGKSP
ncbi:M23 family metallopeptidase [Leifsonia sp. McL0607]|uniref:M23 family metallopeptidase n=1 Tax=Leifsonia sp. McL0607 TaxID=3415672 RepID=UPI003CFB6605